MSEVALLVEVDRRQREWSVAPGETLLEALRRHNVLGPKLVCGTGDCCACGVILNGLSINACITPALRAQGGSVLTVEGLAKGSRLHPIQEAFAVANAAQCGFCTPGFVIRAHALLAEHPDPSEAHVRHALGGNLCRCTGYVKPVEAVLAAAAAMRDEREGQG